MLIIVDNKIPQQAKDKLSHHGSLLELETNGITYEAISGHPDIFFHPAGEQLIVAPNLPAQYVEALKDEGVCFIMGEQAVGNKYPRSAAYNVVSTNNLLIHNFRNTDASITSLLEDADLIHVDQGYTRCNLLPLGDDHFISSDSGISRVLGRFDKDCLNINPEGILLESFDHGFFGGCCGIHEQTIYIIGSLSHFSEGEKTRSYIQACGFKIVELYNGPLFDGGSIFFINT